MKKRLNTQLDDRMAIQYYHWIRQYAGEQGWNTNKVNLIDKELFNTIMRVYEKGNRFIAREYFDRDELFFEPFQEKKITRFEIEDFHSDELLDLFVFVVEKMFDSRLEIADRDKLESQYLSVKAELDAIHASRGWKWLQKLRAIRRMSRVN